MKENARILLVDDNLLSLNSLYYSLLSNGFQVQMYDNAESALKEFKRGHFDIVAADYHMPEMNGEEFLTAIMKADKDVLTIIFSGYTTDDMIANANKVGINHFLSKPICFQEMYNIFKYSKITS